MAGMLDLEDYIKDWAWQMFDAVKTKDESKMPRDQLELIINWSRVKFQHGKLYLCSASTRREPGISTSPNLPGC